MLILWKSLYIPSSFALIKCKIKGVLLMRGKLVLPEEFIFV